MDLRDIASDPGIFRQIPILFGTRLGGYDKSEIELARRVIESLRKGILVI